MPDFDDGLAETEMPAGRGGDRRADRRLRPGRRRGGAHAWPPSAFRNIMITKYRWTANTPRAHITNQRAMEIFRDLGIEDQVLADATPHELVGDTVFCTSIAGRGDRPDPDLGHPPGPRGRLPAGLAVPDLRHPADLPGADPGQERHRARHPDPVLHRVPAPRAGRRRASTYDGAGPADRRRLHHPVQVPDRRRRRPVDGRRAHRPADAKGQMDIAGSMNITFKADISAYVGHRPSVLYWVIQPGSNVGGIGAGLVRMIRPWHEWLIVWGYDISQPPPEVDEQAATQIVRSLLGLPGPRGRDHRHLAVGQQRDVRHPPAGGPGVLRRRRDPPAPAEQRARVQHLRPGLLQPGLEARGGAARAGRPPRCSRPTRPSARRSPGRSCCGPTSQAASSASSSRRSG